MWNTKEHIVIVYAVILGGCGDQEEDQRAVEGFGGSVEREGEVDFGVGRRRVSYGLGGAEIGRVADAIHSSGFGVGRVPHGLCLGVLQFHDLRLPRGSGGDVYGDRS